MSQLTERRLVRNGQTLIGLKITSMRYMSEEERRRLHIEGRSAVIALSDGTLLYPMADDEGSEAGTIVAQLYDGEELRFPVLTRDGLKTEVINVSIVAGTDIAGYDPQQDADLYEYWKAEDRYWQK